MELTEKDLYWLGYLHADGSVGHNGLVRFAQKEIEPVEEFLDYVGRKTKISKTDRMSNFGHNVMHCASTCSPVLFELCHSLGVKTDDLSKKLTGSRHFWRGAIDGDGSISWMKVGLYKYPCLALCGTPGLVESFMDYAVEVVGGNSPKPYMKGTTMYARYGGGKARKLLDHLYTGNYSANRKKRERAESMVTLGRLIA